MFFNCEINNNEIQAFEELSKFFKIENNNLENIKKKALKFSLLKDNEMLEEYFKI